MNAYSFSIHIWYYSKITGLPLKYNTSYIHTSTFQFLVLVVSGYKISQGSLKGIKKSMEFYKIKYGSQK